MKPLRIKYNQRPFTVARDDAGVPHITAASWLEALYGLGYLHAMDRTTQILFARVMASGRSAELIANRPELLEADRLFRRVGLYLRLDEEVDRLPPDDRAECEAYAQGVNDGLKQAGRSFPMWATRFQPEPWDAQSILLIGNLLNFGGLAVGQQQQERLILELIQAGVDDARLRELFAPQLDDADFELLRKVKIASRLSDEALQMLTDLPHLEASNAWAVSPSRSATGAALLASDPHLEVNRLPAIWYEAVLRWGERYVLGASLPGCPIFAVGRTNDLAWGVTHLKGDTSDYFIEDCREQDGRWQYRRGNELGDVAWRDFDVRQETISRKGGKPDLQRIHHNGQGTLECDPQQLGPGLQLLSAWTGSLPGSGQSMTAWTRLVHTRTAREAMDGVRDSPQPTLCWVFADRQGHIGLQANGWFPKRPPHCNGLVPMPAWDERNHWQGVLPADILPSVFDPPEGYLSTANEPLNPPQGPLLVTLPIPDYRQRRIIQRLGELPRATLADMQAIQYDVVSLHAKEMLAVLLPHLPDGKLKAALAAWDGNYAPGTVEATLFTRLHRRVLLEVFGQDPREHGGLGARRMLYLSTRPGVSIPLLTAIDRLLRQEDSRWWRDRDKGDLIRRAAEGLAERSLPLWAHENSFRFRNRFLESDLMGRALGFHTGDLPMPGNFATPFQGHLLRMGGRETSFAPSYHFVCDLATDEAWTNLPGGPSESRFSRWYKSDIPRWSSGQYKRLAAE
jgi:penicillin amidase